MGSVMVTQCAAIADRRDITGSRCKLHPAKNNGYFCEKHWEEVRTRGVLAIVIRGMPGLDPKYGGSSYFINLAKKIKVIEESKKEKRVELKKEEPVAHVDVPVKEEPMKGVENEEIFAETQSAFEDDQDQGFKEAKGHVGTTQDEEYAEGNIDDLIDKTIDDLPLIPPIDEPILSPEQAIEQVQLEVTEKLEKNSEEKNYINKQDRQLKKEYERMSYAEIKIIADDLKVYKKGKTKGQLINLIVQKIKEVSGD